MARNTSPEWSLSKSLGLMAKLLLVICLLAQLAIALVNFFSKPSQATSPTPPPPVVNITINNQPPSSGKQGRSKRQSKTMCSCARPGRAENCDVPTPGTDPVKEHAGIIPGDESAASHSTP